MSEHTPTPWMYSEVNTQGGHMFKVGSPEMVAGKHGAICLYDDRTSLNPHADGVQHANAAFIVRAVNSHEALKEFAEWVLKVGPENSLLALNARHALKGAA